MTTTELETLLATPAAFRAWLEAKEPGEVVGGDWIEPFSDPCAQWLRETTGVDFMTDAIGVASQDKSAPFFTDTPHWLGLFDETLDWTNAPITAAECLRILDEIEGGEG